MFNQFHLIGRVNKLSEDNPDYPGIYLELLDTKELVPVSFTTEVLKKHLDLLANGDMIIVKGIVSMKNNQIVLIVERVTIVPKSTDKIVKEVK